MKLLEIAFNSLNIRRTMFYYAVACGRKVGIYNSWAECEAQVKGFSGARYKKFPTRSEAEAFLKGGQNSKLKGASQYSPQSIAVPLGRSKGVRGTAEQTTGDNGIEATTNGKDYWPPSDGDSVEEGALTDADLLTALAEVEGIPEIDSMASETLKRKGGSAAGCTPSKMMKHDSRILEPVGLKHIGPYEFEIDCEGYVIVYTDGSCINNGQKNASAGFGVYFGDDHPLNAAKPVSGRVTNNVGEIQASIYAIKIAKDLGIRKLAISTDSQFLINSITMWVRGWKAKNWRLKSGEPVKNVDDFKELDALLQDESIKIKWNYVKAHKGIKGNEMADKLAREGSDIYKRLHLK